MDQLRATHFGRPISQREISRGLRFYQLRQLVCDWRYRAVSKFKSMAQ
jgi:hypothetical protein